MKIALTAIKSNTISSVGFPEELEHLLCGIWDGLHSAFLNSIAGTAI
jgi:hypothetical protein